MWTRLAQHHFHYFVLFGRLALKLRNQAVKDELINWFVLCRHCFHTQFGRLLDKHVAWLQKRVVSSLLLSSSAVHGDDIIQFNLISFKCIHLGYIGAEWVNFARSGWFNFFSKMASSVMWQSGKECCKLTVI